VIINRIIARYSRIGDGASGDLPSHSCSSRRQWQRNCASFRPGDWRCCCRLSWIEIITGKLWQRSDQNGEALRPPLRDVASGSGGSFALTFARATREASTSRWSLRPARQAIRLTSSPPATVSARRSNGSRVMTMCKPSSPTLWHRSAGYNAPHLTLTFADPLETASDRARGGSLGATEP
jgi:hypothetical protein